MLEPSCASGFEGPIPITLDWHGDVRESWEPAIICLPHACDDLDGTGNGVNVSPASCCRVASAARVRIGEWII